MSAPFPHIAVIDPALRRPELEALFELQRLSPLPLTYHQPAMHGAQSLDMERDEDLKGIIVMGSGASVNDRVPWQKTLEAWLTPRLERGVPTLGICYGHQMLAAMLGGSVGYVFIDRSKHVGMREVRLAEDLPPHAPADWRGARGALVVSHREQVERVPSELRILATSAVVPHDGFVHATLPIYSFQSHPEAALGTVCGFGFQLPDARPLQFGHGLVRSFLHMGNSDRLLKKN